MRLRMARGPSRQYVYFPDSGHALQLLSPGGGVEFGGSQYEGVGLREAALLAHRLPGGFVALPPRLLVAWIGQPEAQSIEAFPGFEVRGAAGEADLEGSVCLALRQAPDGTSRVKGLSLIHI